MLGAVLRMEPIVLHDKLIIWNSTLLAPGSSIGCDGSQQQAPSEDSKVTRLLKLVSKEALEQAQQSTSWGCTWRSCLMFP